MGLGAASMRVRTNWYWDLYRLSMRLRSVTSATVPAMRADRPSSQGRTRPLLRIQRVAPSAERTRYSSSNICWLATAISSFSCRMGRSSGWMRPKSCMGSPAKRRSGSSFTSSARFRSRRACPPSMSHIQTPMLAASRARESCSSLCCRACRARELHRDTAANSAKAVARRRSSSKNPLGLLARPMTPAARPSMIKGAKSTLSRTTWPSGMNSIHWLCMKSLSKTASHEA